MTRKELKQLIREVIEESGATAKTIFSRWIASRHELSTVQKKFMDALVAALESGLSKTGLGNAMTIEYDEIRDIGSSEQSIKLKNFREINGHWYNCVIFLSARDRKAKVVLVPFSWKAVSSGQAPKVEEDITNAVKVDDIMKVVKELVKKLESGEAGEKSSTRDKDEIDTSF